MKDVIVYTAIFDGKDDLKEPQVVSDRCKYICFTDNPNYTSDVWEIRVVDPGMNDGNLNAKYFKVLPHKCLADEEIGNSIWVDGAREIIGDIEDVINAVDNFEFENVRLLKHPEGRTCLFDEIDHILRLAQQGNVKAPPHVMMAQKQKYIDAGMPRNFGLFNCPILIRKHNDPETVRLNEAWWEEILSISKRDQVSLPYVLWKNDIKFEPIPLEKFNGDRNNVFKWYSHKK